MDSKRNSIPVLKDRPKSSRFPSLVPKSPENDLLKRSSSIDYSFGDSKSHLKFDINLNKNLSNNQINVTEIKTFSDQQINEKIESIIPLNISPVLNRDSNSEYQRIKNENQVLKNNFLRMSRIIQKHSRLMTKKDEIILKLQERNSSNYLPLINYKSNHLSNNYQDQSDQSELNTSKTRLNGLITFEEISNTNIEFSAKFRQIYDSMITDFSQHLTQFMKVIEEMQKFLENNLKIIDKRYSNETGFQQKLNLLNTEYSELKNSYELLTKQNLEFKSFIECVVQSCDLDSKQDLTANELTSYLKKYLTDLFAKNQSLSVKLESINNSRKSEEEYGFNLIEALSDTELELELSGRNPLTLNKVIEKLELKLMSIREKLSQTYLESLKKILIQIYINQLKWLQIHNKSSKSTQTWIHNRIDDSSTEDEDIVLRSDEKQLVCGNKSESQVSNEKNIVKNEISEEIQSKLSELSDELSFDEFDIESINYILMSKHFDYNLKSNLEVVEEVEEEEEEEEVEESDSSYEDNVFEELNECSDNCLKVKEEFMFSDSNECLNLENIESIIKQILNEILDQIDNQFVDEITSDNLIHQIFEREIVEKENSPINSIDLNIGQNKYPNHSTDTEFKPQYVDSDFVSDDLSSSPETVMAFVMSKDLKSDFHNQSSAQHLTNFDELISSKQKSVLETFKDQSVITQIDNQNTNFNQKLQTKENQYLSDELRAWKELVEQQKVIMEKIRTELELQQKLNMEKDETIESLKTQSKSKGFVENPQNQTSVEKNFSEFINNSDDECKTSIMDELDLNFLFIDSHESDDNDLEVILANDLLNNEKIDSNSQSTDNKRSTDILKQNVWTNADSFMDQNYETFSSVYTGNSSPLSVPEELLLSNRRKVFIPYSHEDAAVRRHSCQDRIIRYGNHPRKKKLELKNVDIVFPEQKDIKRFKVVKK